MNIFFSDQDPVKAAINLDDKRVIKMILESAQMLCTALHMHGASHLAKYRVTHANHPSNIWVRENRSNYLWLLQHMKALSDEYNFRTGKMHKTYKELYDDLVAGASFIPDGGISKFANCAARQDMNINYKHVDDVCLAYRLYLKDRWASDKILPKWTGRLRPF
jgi:hypothetical protein